MGSAKRGMSGAPKAQYVWITRTDTGAASSAAAVTRAGFTPLTGPLLTLSAVSTPACAPEEDSVLAFTSPNGVLAFRALSDRREWTVYTVGDATAKAARDAGFETVKSAGGDVDDLAALLINDVPKFVTYLSGVHVAGDLIGALEAADIPCTRTIIYGSKDVSELPKTVLTELENKQMLCALLYSPKAAHNFCRLLPAAFAPLMHCICISPNVDAVLSLSGYSFASRQIASAPDEPSMTALLEAAALKA